MSKGQGGGGADTPTVVKTQPQADKLVKSICDFGSKMVVVNQAVASLNKEQQTVDLLGEGDTLRALANAARDYIKDHVVQLVVNAVVTLGTPVLDFGYSVVPPGWQATMAGKVATTLRSTFFQANRLQVTSKTAGGMDDAMQRLTKDFKHWSSVGLLSNSAREAAASFEGRLGKLKQYVVSVQAINLILNKLGSLSPDDKRKEVETLLEDVSNRNTSLLKDVLVWLKSTAGI
eukprot:TRINITY_DN5780_c0_g1_i6.p1 TRINITY_DN5780_c0_g1~~TRINITY_DN5780_c0_g1_i6.p1  ORF type:complete len:232 (+),score=65.87 TRINITY_DN5780_c0_g1_i6:499-1194(+)